MSGLISKETCERIWCCYREIESGKKLLGTMTEALARGDEPTLKDAFGRQRQLQLGIPSGESGHRLYDVPPQLATSVIRAHIAEKERALVEFNEQARIELGAEPEQQSASDDLKKELLEKLGRRLTQDGISATALVAYLQSRRHVPKEVTALEEITPQRLKWVLDNWLMIKLVIQADSTPAS